MAILALLIIILLFVFVTLVELSSIFRNSRVLPIIGVTVIVVEAILILTFIINLIETITN